MPNSQLNETQSNKFNKIEFHASKILNFNSKTILEPIEHNWDINPNCP